MIREIPSLLAGAGVLMLFGLVVTGARSPQEADMLMPSAYESTAIQVESGKQPAPPAPALAYNNR